MKEYIEIEDDINKVNRLANDGWKVVGYAVAGSASHSHYYLLEKEEVME